MLSRESAQFGACFTAASLLEVCVHPSPGLVSPIDTGAHSDMNLLTFMVGSSALSPYFTAFFDLGYSIPAQSPKVLFNKLRQLGVQAESSLLDATSGINTQRGELFLLGLAAGISGLCMARGQPVPSTVFYSTVREACTGLCERDLRNLQNDKIVTNGEQLYTTMGITGIRGEAEAGFPTVEAVGYPSFMYGLNSGLSLNDAGVHSLVSIMSVLIDTTVIHRLGSAGLSMLHRTSRQILDAGSVFAEEGRALIRRTHEDFCRKRLSPGGAADLLAVSMSLYFLKHGFPGPKVVLAPSLFERKE